MEIVSLLLSLECELNRQILGQPHVLPRVLSVLRRGELGLRKNGRPKGSLLLLGPTGTGKTELVLAFTAHLGGTLIRLDMSEFQTLDSLPVLLQHLGHQHERVPRGTLLLDEIEKAHPRILDVCLQLLDASRLTLPDGKVLEFSGFYVAMTSNIAGSEIIDLQHSTPTTLERHIAARAQQALRPELFARIDEVLVFHPLSYETQVRIAQKFLDLELGFLRSQGRIVTQTEAVLPFLVRKGFHPRLGARPMRQAVEKLVGDAVASGILKGESGSGHLVVHDTSELAIIRPELLQPATTHS